MDFIHATPTLFNAGTPKPQLSSRFLLSAWLKTVWPVFLNRLLSAVRYSSARAAGGTRLDIHSTQATGSTTAKGTGGDQ